MSIFFKARGNASVGLFLIRLVLGSLFLISGAQKVYNLQGFINSVQATGQMNDNIAFILAFMLPFMEMIFGALYILGLFTPITSFFLSCMIISFLIVLGVRHVELPFSYNLVFLACTLATLISGAGIISFDALLDRKKIDKKVIHTEQGARTNTNIYSNEKTPDAKVIYVEEKDVKDSSLDNNIKG